MVEKEGEGGRLGGREEGREEKDRGVVSKQIMYNKLDESEKRNSNITICIAHTYLIFPSLPRSLPPHQQAEVESAFPQFIVPEDRVE